MLTAATKAKNLSGSHLEDISDKKARWQPPLSLPWHFQRIYRPTQDLRPLWLFGRSAKALPMRKTWISDFATCRWWSSPNSLTSFLLAPRPPLGLHENQWPPLSKPTPPSLPLNPPHLHQPSSRLYEQSRVLSRNVAWTKPHWKTISSLNMPDSDRLKSRREDEINSEIEVLFIIYYFKFQRQFSFEVSVMYIPWIFEQDYQSTAEAGCTRVITEMRTGYWPWTEFWSKDGFAVNYVKSTSGILYGGRGMGGGRGGGLQTKKFFVFLWRYISLPTPCCYTLRWEEILEKGHIRKSICSSLTKGPCTKRTSRSLTETGGSLTASSVSRLAAQRRTVTGINCGSCA